MIPPSLARLIEKWREDATRNKERAAKRQKYAMSDADMEAAVQWTTLGAQLTECADELSAALQSMTAEEPAEESHEEYSSTHWCPDICPITGRSFFMWIENQEGVFVPTYGGPYDSYTIPERDDDGSWCCERYDHDDGAWVEGWEDTGLIVVSNSIAHPPLVAAKEIEGERRAPVQDYSAGIPWSMHMRAYDAYCKRFGRQPALIEGNCRGGFHTDELDMFIPGWRQELEQQHSQERAGWQPIETAPKDGTYILVHGISAVRDWEGTVVVYFGMDWATVPGNHEFKPTHWQPLPAAPLAEKP